MWTEDNLPLFENAQAWTSASMAARTDWTHEMSASEIAEIDAAITPLDASGLDILDIGVKDFPLPGFAARLAGIRHDVLHGRGFHLIRGLPVERYTRRQAAIAYWGIGLHVGEAVSQNGKGHVLGHVANLGLDYGDPEVRGYQTKARLHYHCDASDIVALLCLRTAQSGGLSSVVSSTTCWNELVRRRPDCALTLLQPLYYTRWGEVPGGKLHYDCVPVFALCQGRMITTYVRSAVLKAQALPGVPQLTKAQIEAMDVLDSLTADPELHLDMAFLPGDIQLVSNYSVFHSRTSYEDWPEIERRRHLMRLWLACSDGPAVPPFLNERHGQTASGRPDGIRVPGVRLVAPLEAV
ncbi:TauD/TfdA family dioxygenase [Polaromonas sp. P1(28)-13]|nr:TauD/TfdA family dioxygenase [Polaromonas sp. P1(28)-13]